MVEFEAGIFQLDERPVAIGVNIYEYAMKHTSHVEVRRYIGQFVRMTLLKH